MYDCYELNHQLFFFFLPVVVLYHLALYRVIVRLRKESPVEYERYGMPSFGVKDPIRNTIRAANMLLRMMPDPSFGWELRLWFHLARFLLFAAPLAMLAGLVLLIKVC